MCDKHLQGGTCDHVIDRRRFLMSTGKLAALGVAAPIISAFSGCATRKAVAPSILDNAMSANEVLSNLMRGNARYVSGDLNPRDFSATRAALAKDQKPIAAILCCADSRVAPELAFDKGRGQLFVVRIAGNFLEPGGLASFEYAVKFLGTPLIVVLGHSACGAIDAAVKVVEDNAKLPGHLPELVDAIKPAVRAAKKETGSLLVNSIKANVILNVNRIKSAAPVVSNFVSQGKVRVVGGVYDLATGRVELVA
jgi:carbonic anhydrase